jgi:hypothetical protein
MKLGILLKAKLLSIILASVAVTGGAAAIAAATPAGQHALHALTGQANVTATPNSHGNQGNTCAGDPEAKNLATKFSLSTDSSSGAMQAICELHAGTFTGTAPDGTTKVSSSRVYGYGEIEMLLTYAQYLAKQDQNTLTSDNVSSYLAEALNSCGTMPLEQCLKTNIKDYHPGNGKGNGSSKGNDNGNGKPQTTPTPPPHPSPTPHN